MGLPEQVEPLRLSAHAQWKGQPTREQQQLHYQWFADLGSTEAKRALGQILTQGAHRDPVSALRYFRSEHQLCPLRSFVTDDLRGVCREPAAAMTRVL